MSANEPKKHRGSCHCGAVQYEVEADTTSGSRCNCSICTKVNGLSVMVKPPALRVLSGEDAMSTYEWGHKIGKRYFCKTCGVHLFSIGHLAEVGGDFASINMNTLDDVELMDVDVGYWDGRHDNWEAGLKKTPWPIFRAP